MVNLTLQRRLAAQVLKCASDKVRFKTDNLSEIKESITKADIKGLIGEGTIYVKVSPGSSRAGARKILIQKKKGLRKGHGSRKGTANARLKKKGTWIIKIRKQRTLLKLLKDKNLITVKIHQQLASKAKGGFFRSERHLKVYMNEHDLITKK